MRRLTRCRTPAGTALRKAELSILLTDNKRIRVLNRDWRKKDKATDVLSFPQQDLVDFRRLRLAARKGDLEPWELGDVVISMETAKSQARERGHSLKKELSILLAHGILHLLGYDHEISPQEERRMRRWERRLLSWV